MADIFISYSSKDREQATMLSELLASAGLSVWIDRHGIDAATSWSGEIVDAIDGCKALLLLLSPNSILSENVVKEVSLAAEKKKKILPLDLEPVSLPRDLQYHLAGLQRTSMSNINSIVRALGKIGLEATQAPTIRLIKETDDRKSLMILPFEDLSPTGDNGWFTDGIVSELIQSLSNIKALRLMDARTTKEFKSFKGQLTVYAREMSIRYFVQGDVRKFGDHIKINSRLLDIETGDHLWQDSLKGTMDDIFDIQEKVAERVVEGLKVHLAPEEKQKLAERGTENVEAYELWLKGREYFVHQTKEGFAISAQLCDEAIRLDPNYFGPLYQKALSLIQLYRFYDRNLALLDEAEFACREMLRLNPDNLTPYDPLAQIFYHRGEFDKAEKLLKEYIVQRPQSALSHYSLAFLYGQAGMYDKAIAPYEEALRLEPENLLFMTNLTYMCDSIGEREKCKHWASVSLPHVQRSLKLNPDSESRQLQHVMILFLSGDNERARIAAKKLTHLKDGNNNYNMACILSKMGDRVSAIQTLIKAIEAGFRNTQLLKDFLADEKEGIVDLAGTPEYETVKQMVEEIEREEEAKKSEEVNNG